MVWETGYRKRNKSIIRANETGRYFLSGKQNNNTTIDIDEMTPANLKLIDLIKEKCPTLI